MLLCCGLGVWLEASEKTAEDDMKAKDAFGALAEISP